MRSAAAVHTHAMLELLLEEMSASVQVRGGLSFGTMVGVGMEGDPMMDEIGLMSGKA